ncbi:hypothetical protein [Streptacidiphilus sp. PAMC 29251]
MHVLVASSGNAMLETAPTRTGHRVSLLVPTDTTEQRREDTPQAEGVYGTPRWHEQGALSRLLPHLPTEAIGLARPGGAL